MRKCIFVLMFTTLISTTAFADYHFSVDSFGENVPLLPFAGDEYRNGYYFDFNNKSYIIGMDNSQYTLPKEKDAIEFSNNPNYEEYIVAGDYYMVRDTTFDSTSHLPNGAKTYLKFYDKDLNLVAKNDFGKIVSKIGYFNSTCYCELKDLSHNKPQFTTMKSTDMKNWEETDEVIPHNVGDLTIADGKIALIRDDLTDIIYESRENYEFYSTLGDWILAKDSNNNFYLSNDNVYYIKVEYPPEQKSYDDQYNLTYYFKCIYEYGENIVIDLIRSSEFNLGYYQSKEELDTVKEKLQNESGKTLRLTVPKAEIYAELERQKSTPYIMLNGKILGFEQAPIVEQDRTLVPMRFLFEQMGANVDWDENTETATVTKNGEQISFQIDSPAAKVDSEVKLMDVPAKLVSDKTMVPLRFLSENLGYNVQWDEATKMVIITTE